MLVLCSKINHSVVQAKSECDFGRLEDILFDDAYWTVRSLEVNTSKWLLGHSILIPPFSVRKILPADNVALVSLSKKQLEDLPTLDKHELASNKDEQAYDNYFGSPHDWGGTKVQEISSDSTADKTNNIDKEVKENQEEILHSHLQSMNEINGYDIHATDGHIGRVADFLFDSDTWEIRYLIIERHRWLPGPCILLSPAWVRDVSWEERSVNVDVTKQTIQEAPKFNMPLTRDDELAIFKHINKDQHSNSFRLKNMEND